MGRETRILLALLGLLAGVFLGVVSMKLFVPRPPAGTGPDIHGAPASREIATVPPPDLETGAVPHAVAAVAEVAEAPAAEAPSPPGSRFGRDMEPPRRDPFVTPASFPEAVPPVAESFESVPAAAGDEPTPPPPDVGAAEPTAASGVRGSPDTYVVAAGDSWWAVAERAYGDGRLYRALFAWNRGLDPRVALMPGTRLEIPSLDRLAAAWPALLPPP